MIQDYKKKMQLLIYSYLIKLNPSSSENLMNIERPNRKMDGNKSPDFVSRIK